jgi:hypothetical protein
VSAPITELLDQETVVGIAEQTWFALVGEEEVVAPSPTPRHAATTSAWVEVVGPWTGSVVLSCLPETATELTRALLGGHAPAELGPEDVEDALGELANVLGGNVKALLPGPSALGLPEVGTPPPAVSPVDTCRVELAWRGQPLTVSVQGAVRFPRPYPTPSGSSTHPTASSPTRPTASSPTRPTESPSEVPL